MRRVILLICVALMIGWRLEAQQSPYAEMVIQHGHVWTVDAAHPQAEAVAITGSHIVAVGSDAEIAKWVGPATKKIDAQGKSVLPGFIDAHVHFTSGGAEIKCLHLPDHNTPEELSRRIAEKAKKQDKGEWIR